MEGAGKDHYAAGGSRDIAKRISEEVFNYPEPFNIPYEFFNIFGKDKSSIIIRQTKRLNLTFFNLCEIMKRLTCPPFCTGKKLIYEVGKAVSRLVERLCSLKL